MVFSPADILDLDNSDPISASLPEHMVRTLGEDYIKVRIRQRITIDGGQSIIASVLVKIPAPAIGTLQPAKALVQSKSSAPKATRKTPLRGAAAASTGNFLVRASAVKDSFNSALTSPERFEESLRRQTVLSWHKNRKADRETHLIGASGRLTTSVQDKSIEPNKQLSNIEDYGHTRAMSLCPSP
jgi:hypothetical protein